MIRLVQIDKSEPLGEVGGYIVYTVLKRLEHETREKTQRICKERMICVICFRVIRVPYFSPGQPVSRILCTQVSLRR